MKTKGSLLFTFLLLLIYSSCCFNSACDGVVLATIRLEVKDTATGVRHQLPELAQRLKVESNSETQPAIGFSTFTAELNFSHFECKTDTFTLRIFWDDVLVDRLSVNLKNYHNNADNQKCCACYVTGIEGLSSSMNNEISEFFSVTIGL